MPFTQRDPSGSAEPATLPRSGTRPTRRSQLRAIWRALKPKPVGVSERLAAFPTEDLPLQREVVIRWNDSQVPHIEAETDRDLFVALGLVHAHLRAGQITLFQAFYEGRLAELVGAPARGIDHAMRILDYAQAAEAVERSLPEQTKAWLVAFVEGMNVYYERCPEPPPELALFGPAARLRPATLRDVIVGARFAGTDFTWVTYLALLSRRDRPGFARLWNRTLQAGENPTPGTHAEGTPATLEDLLVGGGRPGSNSIAVAPHRSATGAAILANDPHLGLSLPSLWLLAGIRSPSFDVVGFMIPGLPCIMLGRNPDLAWGGTNMRSASSDLFDVSGLPASQIETRQTTIRARFGRARSYPVRRTPFGPIITDAKVVRARADRPLALKWVGQDPSDEFTAFFRSAQARTPETFRAAFETYAVSGQNMLFADRAGNIGKIMAVKIPRRNGFPEDDPALDAADPKTHWRGYVNVMDLPFLLNPPDGVIASANDRPTDTDIPVGFTFGSEDRIRRLYALLARRESLSVQDMEALQTDTNAPDAALLASALVREIEAVPGGVGRPKFMRRLSRWAGDYGADAFGAVAFECLLFHLVPPLYGGKRASQLPDLLGQWSYLTTFLIPDLDALETGEKHRMLKRAVRRAARDAARFRQWGDMHRLKVGHMLARLPGIGRCFEVADLPIGGSRQTPMKMAHGLVRHRHAATFGQMARHISEMSDLDANWFVMLGGNDGWLGSANFADQVDLWREGRYLRMPLKRETVIAEFPYTTRLKTRAAPPA